MSKVFYKSLFKYTLKPKYYNINKCINNNMSYRYFSSNNDEITITFITQNDTKIDCQGNIGSTLLDVCLDNELDVEGACGGECCCSTCHLYLSQDIYDIITKPDEDELDMLDLAIGVKNTSRLGCQVKVIKEMDGKIFSLPKEVMNNLPDN